VEGSEYPPPPLNQLLVRILTAVQFVCWGLIFFGDKVFQMLGMASPEWYASVKENKTMSAVGVFFLGNMIAGNLISTGAFELTYGTETVWSKLQTGGMPTIEHIVSELQRIGVDVAMPSAQHMASSQV